MTCVVVKPAGLGSVPLGTEYFEYEELSHLPLVIGAYAVRLTILAGSALAFISADALADAIFNIPATYKIIRTSQLVERIKHGQ